MKKLVIANAVLLVMFNTLSSSKLELKETILPTLAVSIKQEDISSIAIIQEEITENSDEHIVEITSRSAEPRQDVEILSTTATTYSENCINLIKKYEGFKSKAYQNKGEKYLTIGYGHYGADIKEGQVISEEQAERLLIAEIEGIKDYILKQGFNFNQNELDSMISFAYNCGLGNFNKLTKGRTKTEIAEHIESYTSGNMKGLIKRRAEEKELFTKGEV